MRALLSLGILVATLFGYSAKGLGAYKKFCMHCHGPAFKGAAMMESDEWEELFANRAQKLKALHDPFPKTRQKLKSRTFERKREALFRFLKNNARDLGVVRSCDGLNCG